MRKGSSTALGRALGARTTLRSEPPKSAATADVAAWPPLAAPSSPAWRVTALRFLRPLTCSHSSSSSAAAAPALLASAAEPPPASFPPSAAAGPAPATPAFCSASSSSCDRSSRNSSSSAASSWRSTVPVALNLLTTGWSIVAWKALPPRLRRATDSCASAASARSVGADSGSAGRDARRRRSRARSSTHDSSSCSVALR
mmetsp:Transcript_10439/g.36335  ORF Transcript_10439/g.36335 Transcript_10439/m.36335 type:complete len:200 (-) Transcript_10439:97-696(-)